MNNKTFAVILLAALLAGVMIGWAVTKWTGTITWEEQTESFTVWDSSTGGLEIATPWNPSTIQVPYPSSPQIYDFYLQNDGNVEITVEATTTTSIGCTPSWSGTGSYTIPVGTTRVQATLTLTITGDGSYSFEFNIAP